MRAVSCPLARNSLAVDERVSGWVGDDSMCGWGSPVAAANPEQSKTLAFAIWCLERSASSASPCKGPLRKRGSSDVLPGMDTWLALGSGLVLSRGGPGGRWLDRPLLVCQVNRKLRFSPTPSAVATAYGCLAELRGRYCLDRSPRSDSLAACVSRSSAGERQTSAFQTCSCAAPLA